MAISETMLFQLVTTAVFPNATNAMLMFCFTILLQGL